ncbi:cell number regulator 2-like [Cornus florida]|uniref:cell number regulator 2-like n=1 Tax=Cornus florida TaxID=4283 RepID=UPI00289A4972|nr:cell number regulator 2-like [Cornus florida]
MDSSNWSTGLCDCFSDCRVCCLTFFCPCITFGRIAEILSRGSTSCCVSGTMCTLMGGTHHLAFHNFYTSTYRTKLKKHYSIEPNQCEDCLIHMCFQKCALCQEYRELQQRGFEMSIGWEKNVEKQTRGVTTMAPMMGTEGMKR